MLEFFNSPEVQEQFSLFLELLPGDVWDTVYSTALATLFAYVVGLPLGILMVTGEAGGGLVKVTMTGTGKVSNVTIDPKIVDPEDIETLQDLVVGAYNNAHENVAQLAETKLGPLAGGMGGLGDMMGGLGM